MTDKLSEIEKAAEGALWPLEAPVAKERPEIAEARARAAASRCIGRVRESYANDATKASSAGLADVARLYWAIVSGLDRAAALALAEHDYDTGLGEGCTRCAALPGESALCEPPAPATIAPKEGV